MVRGKNTGMRFSILFSLLIYCSSTFAQVGNHNNVETNTPVLTKEEQVLDTLYEQLNDQHEKALKIENDLRERSVIKKTKASSVNAEAMPAEMNQMSKPESSGYAATKLVPVMEDFNQVQQAVKSNAISRSPLPIQQQQMDASVQYMEQVAPSSFEYHLSMYTSGNYDTKRIAHLNEAELLQPQHPTVQVQKTAYFIAIGDTLNTKVYLSKLKDQGHLSQDAIDYTHDVLLSVPPKGCLVTHGFDDSYGAYFNQQVNDLRPDVCVASLDFMQGAAYKTLLNTRNLKFSQISAIDTTFFDDFCRLNESKNIAVSLTLPREYLLSVKEKLFINGLTMTYNLQEPTLLFFTNENLWFNEFKKYTLNNTQTEKGRKLAANYLPMLLTLHHYYRVKGNTAREQELQKVIEKVSALSGKQTSIKSSQKKNK
jgi:hypothetical protein